VGALYLAAPSLLFRPFAPESHPESAELMEIGARMLMLSSAWQLFDAAANTLAEALRAAGDTVFPMWARIAIAWLVFVPGSWVSARVLRGGDTIAVLWVVAYMAILAGVLALRFRGGAWRRIRLVEAPVAAA
jgi:MATE family multidrug resistance protein